MTSGTKEAQKTSIKKAATEEPAEKASDMALSQTDTPQKPSENIEEPRFNAKSGLGFMRVIQFFNVLYIFITLFAMIFVTHNDLIVDYTVMVVCDVIIIFVQSLIVWLIAYRKMHARFIIPVLYFVQFFLKVTSYGSVNGLDTQTVVLELITPILMTIYFLTSRRAKAVLVQPLDLRFIREEKRDKQEMWNPRSLNFWLRLLIYFFAFSVFGHWMERALQILIKHHLFPGTVASPDSLTYLDYWNPFPIYGIAVVVCGLVLYPIYMKLREKLPKAWQAFLISFLINTAFCTIAELILGFCFNTDYSAWDYRNQFLNFEGQICLLYTVSFGILSSIITWLIYPLLEHLFSYVSRDAFRIIFILSLLFWLFVFVTYNIDLGRMGVYDSLITAISSAKSS